MGNPVSDTLTGLKFKRLPQDPPRVQTYYTKAEAATYTRHAPRTIDYAVKSGELRAFKPSRKLLFLRSDLDNWIQQRRANADLDRILNEVVAELTRG